MLCSFLCCAKKYTLINLICLACVRMVRSLYTGNWKDPQCTVGYYYHILFLYHVKAAVRHIVRANNGLCRAECVCARACVCVCASGTLSVSKFVYVSQGTFLESMCLTEGGRERLHYDHVCVCLSMFVCLYVS